MYIFYIIQTIYFLGLFLAFYKNNNVINNCNYIESLFSINKTHINYDNIDDTVNTESYDLINDENDIVDVDILPDENISLFNMIYYDIKHFVLHDYLDD